ncbi:MULTISPECIES: hypothetical protein [unclassified Streptomyces]|uniref:hypothetical protein n=1 Tax=unclassified Streptomyces TaxID=2593676 RepID=UPI00344BAE58
MSRLRRGRHRAAAALAAALLLGGCGIQQTDVIAAGGPATIQVLRHRNSQALLFFRLPDGRLNPVPRSITPYGEGGGPRASAEDAVRALLAGPGEEGEALGLGTALPPAAPGGVVRVTFSAQGGVRARLPLPLGELDATARHQLICTIAYATVSGAEVRMTGQDDASASGTCGLGLPTGVVPTRPAPGRGTVPPPATG